MVSNNSIRSVEYLCRILNSKAILKIVRRTN